MSEESGEPIISPDLETGRKRFPLAYKIFLFTLVPLILVILIMSILTIQNKADTEQELVENRLESFVSLLESGELSFESIEKKERLENIFQEKVIHAQIIGRDFGVVYSTEGQMKQQIDSEERMSAFQALEGYKISFTQKLDGKTTFEWYYPLVVERKVIGVFNAELSYERSRTRIMQHALFIFILDLVGIIVIISAIYFVISRTLLADIGKLKDATEEISRGNLGFTADVKSGDELEELGFFFNKMSYELKHSQKTLENYSKDLEEKVEKRTRELKIKNAELEQFNKLAIGRELQIVEMKHKIEELEARLKGKKPGSVKKAKIAKIKKEVQERSKTGMPFPGSIKPSPEPEEDGESG